MLRIALQAGAMKPAMIDLFRGAYLPIVQQNEASFDGAAGPHQVRFMKSSTIPQEVIEDYCDCGITGQDVIFTSGLAEEIEVITDLPLSRRSDRPTKVVLVGIEKSVFPVDGAILYADMEYGRFAEDLAVSNPGLTVKLLLGTSEEKVRSDKEFAIVATETGSSLRANGLEIKQVLMETSMVLFVKKGLVEKQARQVTELGWLLRGVIDARGRVLLKMNVVKDENLNGVLALLPALGSPTVMPLSGGGNAVETVVPTDQFASLVPALKRAGASGILSQDLHSVVL